MQKLHELQYPEVPEYPGGEMFDTPDGPRYIEDEYAWLIQRDNPEVEEYIAAQNSLTAEYMAADDLANHLTARIDELNNSVELRTAAETQGDRLFWGQRSPGQEQLVIMMSGRNGEDPHIAVDPNAMGEGLALNWYVIPPVGQHIAYSLQHNGDARNHIYIRNTITGHEEQFTAADIFNMAWDDTGEGFVYSRSNSAAYGSKDTSSYQQLYYHRIGTEKAEDTLLFDANAQGLKPSAWLSPKGMTATHMITDAYFYKTDIRPYLIDLETKVATPLAAEEDGAHRSSLQDGHVYIFTTHQADNKRLLRMPVSAAHLPLDKWETVLPEDPEKSLRQFVYTKDTIVAEYTRNLASELQIRDRFTGAHIKSVPLPALSSVKNITADNQSNAFRYKVANFLSEGMIYTYDDNVSTCTWEDNRSLDPEEYDVQQEWFESADGVMVPTTLVCKRGLLRHARSSKIILQDQYGGFSSGQYPDLGFNNMRRVWLEYGGVVSLPNNRGGDEFGSSWHTTAIGPNKTRSFDDSVACARYLKETGVAEKVALSGGSNGGLVVLAAMLRAPEVVDAVDARVPLSDMLNYTRYSPDAKYWTAEYGDPLKPEEFAWLAEYSPYHNIDPAAQYRAIITAGLNDKIVDPIHSMKMAARLQRTPSRVLLHLDNAAGHGPGRGASHLARIQGMRLAFLMRELGLAQDTPSEASV